MASEPQIVATGTTIEVVTRLKSRIAALTAAKEAAEAEAKRLRADAEWRDIASAPRGVPVLVYKPNTQEQYVAAYVHGKFGPGWCTIDGFEVFKVTHWKPLSEPPAAAQEQGVKS